MREQFRNSFVTEFLERWKEQPPGRFARRLDPQTEDQLCRDIKEQADRLFDQIVKLDGPNVSVIYNDIAIEDLGNQKFMSALYDVMAKGGLPRENLNRLFERGEAAAGQNSFNSVKKDD